MKTLSTLAIALASASLLVAAHTVQAQGLTREQVRAELAEAVRTGDIVHGERSLKANEIQPNRYPAPAAVPGKTRQQVRDELAAAQRSGDFVVAGDSGLKAYEVFPQRYPARPLAEGKTRQQVRDELALAIRLGDAPSLGELGLTPAQRSPGRFAAVRAEHERALTARQATTVAQMGGDAAPR